MHRRHLAHAVTEQRRDGFTAGSEQAVLGLEVRVEHWLSDPCAGRDLLHRRAVVATLAKHLGRDSQHVLLALLAWNARTAGSAPPDSLYVPGRRRRGGRGC